MKKFINKPEDFVDEMLEGIMAAHSDQLKYVNGDLRCVVTATGKKGKVGLATGGGSGHLPLFLGYVGDGLLDGCSVGGVFQSPSAEQMLEVTKAINSGAGVVYIYGNYGGDVMNFDMAAEMAEMEGIQVLQVVAGDDVASSKKGEEHKRRGVAGIFFVYKIAGACADSMASLEEVKRVADKVCDNVRTMGVALSPCIVPEVGKPSFSIGEGGMEIGMGIHGEPGIEKGLLKSADEVVQQMMDSILDDLPYISGDEVAVLVNGLGATPKEELYIMYRKIHSILKNMDIRVFHVYIGEFATSMEMAGASISLLKLDDELKAYLAKPAATPFFEQKQL
ncbi:MAG: phosphoenolpyruvate---glycerone phosphotransferase subunit DhaK [Verrucomicrobiota bacterium]|jgi:dihydroxyacetone kinase-like protein|nr:phosphoenolpyruvate---glycerone phosphotransferase subunit DhaK [Verrucomicrobiota bacterium]